MALAAGRATNGDRAGMRRRPLAILGPLPPPMTGMEAATLRLLAELERARPHQIRWRHLDTAVNRSLSDRERFQLRKMFRLVLQFVTASGLAIGGYDAYAPISQNTLGLIRDVILLAPFRLMRRRIIVHLHGGVLDQVLVGLPPAVRTAVEWVVSTDEARGVVVTQALQHCFEPLLPPDRIFVVPNSPDAPERLREKPPSPPLRVLFLGNLFAAKGYRELAAAALSLAEAGEMIVLEIAGEPFLAEDAEWVREFGSRSGITMLGYVGGVDKWEALQRAHVLAQPSVAPEGQPLSILEGMAAGCAIVATAHEGIADTVGPEEAVLVPPAEGHALQASLERVLAELSRDPSRVARLGASGRRRYESHYSSAVFLERWIRAVA